MNGKSLRKIVMCFMLKMKIYLAYISTQNSNHENKIFFIDTKWRRMKIAGSKESIKAIKGNNVKTCW